MMYKKINETHKDHKIVYYHPNDNSSTIEPFCENCDEFVEYTYEEIKGDN